MTGARRSAPGRYGSVSRKTRRLLERSRYEGATVGWDDVVGHAPAKRELAVVAAQVRRHSVAEQLGLTLVTGILITGPAGSGKTLLAKALATAVERPVYVIPSSEVDAAAVREVYVALADQPCVIVWDEADVLLRDRWHGGAPEARTVAAFCSALSGVEVLRGPITVALTAEPAYRLDGAAVRAGRLTTHIELRLPDREERLGLWERFTATVPTVSPIDLERAADRSFGMSGADIEATVMVALGLSLVDGTDALRADLLDEAILRRNLVEERSDRPAVEVRRAAIHESGHAIFAALDWGPGSVATVTAFEAGGQGGRTDLDDTMADRLALDLGRLREQVAWCLAGLVAEELVYGAAATSAGGASDLAAATTNARRLVADLGGSSLVGPIDLDRIEAGSDSDRGSEAMRAAAWLDVRAETVAALAVAHSLLEGRRDALERFADRLLEAPDLTLSGPELLDALEAVLADGADPR